MRFLQFMVSVAAAFAFDCWQMSDPLPTPHSWLLCILVVGVGAAWLFTVIAVRLYEAVRFGPRSLLPRLAARRFR